MKLSDRPRVIANFAMSLDGKISTRNHTPSDFTSEDDKKSLKRIRALGDGLIVGRKTVTADRMSMRVGDKNLSQERILRGQSPEPLRIIVSSAGFFDPRWKVFHTAGGKILLICEKGAKEKSAKYFYKRNDVEFVEIQKINASKILKKLKDDYGIGILVCEGGAALFRSFAEIGAVDELYLTLAPCVFGGENAPTLTGIGGDYLPRKLRFCLQSFFMTDRGEFFLHYLSLNKC
ncbi:MAG: dihydrofolate reductase family protein [Chthoniobacterales bacterium]|nr:dihydrofolate reductase family protein [Chthoniobacterales bacterium]